MSLSYDDIDRKIVAEYYVTGPQAFQGDPIHESVKTLTICVLVLQNGHVVTGHSTLRNPNNFNTEVGRHVARERAYEKLWELEGYLLKEESYQSQTDDGC